jgi:hypothetical protein
LSRKGQLFAILLAIGALATACDEDADRPNDSGRSQGTEATPSGSTELLTDTVLPVAQLLSHGAGERELLRRAENILIADCMSSRGYIYYPFVSQAVNDFSMESLFGTITPQQAARYGYHSSTASEYAAADAAAVVTQAKVMAQGAGYLVALSGEGSSCQSLAWQQLYGANQPPDTSADTLMIFDLTAQARMAAGESAPVLAAQEIWKTCMAARGLHYRFLSDSRLTFQSEPGDAGTPSAAEFDSAKADADCRQTAGVDRAFIDTFSDAYTGLTEKHLDVVERLEAVYEQAKRRALSLLANPNKSVTPTTQTAGLTASSRSG